MGKLREKLAEVEGRDKAREAIPTKTEKVHFPLTKRKGRARSTNLQSLFSRLARDFADMQESYGRMSHVVVRIKLILTRRQSR